MERARWTIYVPLAARSTSPFHLAKLLCLRLGREVDYTAGIMQAGDRLDFVQHFNTARTETDPTDDERRDHTVAMGVILQAMLYNRPENVDSVKLFDEGEFITVFEASYRLDMPDASYLHILVHGQQTEHGLLCAGVSVIEHLDDNTFNGGYVYTLDPTGVRRTIAPKDKEDAKMDEEDRTRLFSVIDQYAQLSELEDLEQSEDIDEMMAAIALRAELEEDTELGRMAAEAGFDDLPPDEGELEQLAELIMDAYHYPLRERAG